ncbi:hypothetical protein DAPPUDRAFT_249283 [Daphnia pulex]|uniref:Uncharacterized protein n=1 Tax=Daphnia pulex TaxID=6669 RepID=E9GWC0_DAPPU|nr:hypothetical protein DAPPUDRAFT_249283 [Daphnia pulex]|eukprot:EFX76218.1 hypothetical protein DAPPUDRAFT_249283 [Daphnia pulex]
MTNRQMLIAVLSLFVLQAQFVSPSPTDSRLVKRQSLQSDSTLFLDSVGDLAVGSAALPPLLNVTRAFTRVQQSSTRLFNNTQSVVPEPGTLRDVTRRIAQGIQPAIGLVGQSVNSTFRRTSGNGILGAFGGSSNTTRVNPNDSEIPPEGFEDF